MSRIPLMAVLALTACFSKQIEEGRDRDGDGFVNWELGGDDCDDTDALVNPSADEACGDGVDNNCDGQVDDTGLGARLWFIDADGDGYFGEEEFEQCEGPDGSTTEPGTFDCDDNNSNANPGLEEQCGDDVDNDCDGDIDSDADDAANFYLDADGDGFPSPDQQSECTAPAGSFPDLSGGVDCDDTVFEVSPASEERCGDGVDNDCDGAIDDAGLNDVPWYADSDGDGYPSATENRACEVPAGGFSTLLGGIDCNDLDASINPGATEVYYDGVDQDCAGGNDYDADLDGITSDQHGGTDCDDANAAVRPGVPEVCNNGLDDDCSGDAPECEWPASGNLEDVAYAELTGVGDGISTAAIQVYDVDGDGVSDLLLVASRQAMATVTGPIPSGLRPVVVAIDTQLGSGFQGAAIGVSVFESGTAAEVAVVGLDDGSLSSLSLPLTESSSVRGLLSAPSASRLGRFVGTGRGFAPGATRGMVVLQGAKRPDVTGGWSEGLHVWPFTLPTPSPLFPPVYNYAPLFVEAGSLDWETGQVIDLDGDGDDDVVLAGQADSRTSGTVAVLRAPFADDATLSILPRVLTSGFGLWGFGVAQNTAFAVGELHDTAGLELVVAHATGARVLSPPEASVVHAEATGLRLVPSVPPTSVAVLPIGDFNGNGRADVGVVGRRGAEHWLDVYFDVENQPSLSGQVPPDASFDLRGEPGQSGTTTADLVGSGVGDVTGDGVEDLVVSQYGSIFVLKGSGM